MNSKLNVDFQEVEEYLKQLKFKKTIWGVDEEQAITVIQDINNLYQSGSKALAAQLIETQKKLEKRMWKLGEIQKELDYKTEEISKLKYDLKNTNNAISLEKQKYDDLLKEMDMQLAEEKNKFSKSISEYEEQKFDEILAELLYMKEFSIEQTKQQNQMFLTAMESRWFGSDLEDMAEGSEEEYTDNQKIDELQGEIASLSIELDSLQSEYVTKYSEMKLNYETLTSHIDQILQSLNETEELLSRWRII